MSAVVLKVGYEDVEKVIIARAWTQSTDLNLSRCIKAGCQKSDLCSAAVCQSIDRKQIKSLRRRTIIISNHNSAALILLNVVFGQWLNTVNSAVLLRASYLNL